jgi:hypothetical protein
VSGGPVDTALAALDRALADRPDTVYDDLAEAVRCLVRLRAELVSEFRNGATGDSVERCNAIISLVIGSEYPLSGLHRSRIERARQEVALLRKTRGDAPGVC